MNAVPEVFHCAAEAPHSRAGYWLTKRRDGRSGNWMIARYQARGRSIIYRTCRTNDLGEAIAKLDAHAATAPAAHNPPSPRKSTLVYFIQAETGQIKIGVARDIEKRFAALQTMSPVKLTLVAQCEGGQPAEFAYHKRFAAHRLHGEWFSRCPEIEAEIERLNASPSPLTDGNGNG